MNQILYTFRRTIQHYIDGSFILIAATVIAIIIANSPLVVLISPFGSKHSVCK